MRIKQKNWRRKKFSKYSWIYFCCWKSVSHVVMMWLLVGAREANRGQCKNSPRWQCWTPVDKGPRLSRLNISVNPRDILFEHKNLLCITMDLLGVFHPARGQMIRLVCSNAGYMWRVIVKKWKLDSELFVGYPPPQSHPWDFCEMCCPNIFRWSYQGRIIARNWVKHEMLKSNMCKFVC